MKPSRHFFALGGVGFLLLAIVAVTMFGSGSAVSKIAAADSRFMARDWLATLQLRLDLPGDPVAPDGTLLDGIIAVLFDESPDGASLEPYFGSSGAFEMDQHFGTISGYAIFDRRGRLRILGGQPLMRSMDFSAGRAAARAALETGRWRIAGIAQGSDGVSPVTAVMVPLVRQGAVTGLAVVEITQHRFEVVMQKGVQFVAGATAFAILLIGGIGLLLMYDWGRLAHRAQVRAEYLAHTDPTTQLPNRRRFEEDLADTIEVARIGARTMAVLFCDVDNFKLVNEEYGHGAGDRLLREIGSRLTQMLRAGDKLYRLSGDQFALIVETSCDPREIEALCVQVQEAMGAPLLPDDFGIKLTLSVGAALVLKDGSDVEQVMQAADTALYRAKADGRRTYRMYHEGMRSENTDMARLQHALEEALDRDELHLVYQPQVRAGDKALVGFEALARWTHPVEGIIAPDRFIAVAEQAGLIVQLGEWALRRACQDAALWPEHLSIAINISPLQLRGSRLVEQLKAILDETGLDPSRLELEITESVMMLDTEATKRAFTAIRALGAGLAMDDFGTGYSSLSYLTRIPLTKLKIDKSFISRYGMDEKDDAIVDALVSLGRNLGLKITAEGVETEAQALWLTKAGCTSLQGYLYGRPTASPSAYISDFQGQSPSAESA